MSLVRTSMASIFFLFLFFSRYRFNQIPMKLFFITGEIEYFGFEIRGKISSIAFTCIGVCVCVFVCVYVILCIAKQRYTVSIKKKKLKDEHR